jgi:demethylmenaquinone methyltransferase/2-methoxy-6-polyprenyl-1,4-benzoquinol methylase
MTLNKNETRDLYRRRAAGYDLAVWIYRLFGFRIRHYRRVTVASLALKPGDTVVEIGCGTGLNFRYLQEAVGGEGKVIGVDLTDAMLEIARERIHREGWTDIDLVQSDAAQYEFPQGVSGIFSTLAITLIPEYDAVIQNGAQALRSGGRFAVFDMKQPSNWPDWLVRLTAWLNSPFGVSLEIADRHPWESIHQHLTEVRFEEYYFGALYLSVGERANP